MNVLQRLLPSAATKLDTPARRATMQAVGASVISQGTLLVSGILSAHMLGPEDRGYLALLVVVPSTIAQVGSLGVSISLSYHIARDARHGHALVRVVRRLAILQTLVMTAIHAAVVAFMVSGKGDGFVVAAIVSLSTIPATYAFEYGLALLQGNHQYRQFNLLRVVPNVAYALALLALLLADVGTLLTVLGASLLITAAIGGISIVRGLERLPSEPPAEPAPERGELVSFGLKSYLGYVSPMDSFRLDQLYIGAVLPAAALGQYVVGFAFSNLPRFIGQSIGLVATPHVARLKDADAQVRAVWRFLGLTAALCGGLAALLILAIPWLVPVLFGDAFRDAAPIGQILVLGAFFQAIRRTVTDGARGCGLPTVGSVAEVASLLAFVPAVALLEPALGVEGVAWAFTVAGVFGFVIVVARFAVAVRGRALPAA